MRVAVDGCRPVLQMFIFIYIYIYIYGISRHNTWISMTRPQSRSSIPHGRTASRWPTCVAQPKSSTVSLGAKQCQLDLSGQPKKTTIASKPLVVDAPFEAVPVGPDTPSTRWCRALVVVVVVLVVIVVVIAAGSPPVSDSPACA